MSWKSPIWAVSRSNDAASSPLYPTDRSDMKTPSLRFLSIDPNEMDISESDASSFSISSFARMSVGLVIESAQEGTALDARLPWLCLGGIIRHSHL